MRSFHGAKVCLAVDSSIPTNGLYPALGALDLLRCYTSPPRILGRKRCYRGIFRANRSLDQRAHRNQSTKGAPGLGRRGHVCRECADKRLQIVLGQCSMRPSVRAHAPPVFHTVRQAMRDSVCVRAEGIVICNYALH
ncbi:hypothetical protein AB1N83_010170 [Pleurotus pulmonarius]